MLRSLVRAFALTVTVGGCSLAPQIQENVADYHGVFGNSGDTVVLANIVRSANGLPLHFSILNKINGTITATAQVSVTAPFGEFFPGGSMRNTATPQFTVTSNPNFEVDTLETQNFTAGILAPIDAAKFKNFLDTGIDYRVAMMLFVSGVRLAGGAVILNSPVSTRWVCYPGAAADNNGHLPSGNVYLQYEIGLSREDCDKNHRHSLGEPEIYAFLRILNAVKPFFANQYTEANPIGPAVPVAKIIALGIDKLAGLDPSKIALITTDKGKTYTASSLSTKIVLCETEGEKQGLSLLHSINDLQCKVQSQPLVVQAGNNIGGNLEVLSGASLRSVAGMFDYVGQIVAWQRKTNRCLTVDYTGSYLDRTDPCNGNVFFKLQEAPASSAFNVTYEGHTYGAGGTGRCIPAGPGPSVARPSCDYSSQVMNVLTLALGLNIQPKDLPQTPLIQLLP